jgi:hypothetical protein
MMPLTDFEMERGIAFRTLEDGEIVSYEICAECKRSSLKADHKLGYGAGRPLCRDCYHIGPANTPALRDRVFAALNPTHGRSATVLANRIGANRAEASEALKQLELDGRARIMNQLWFSVEK